MNKNHFLVSICCNAYNHEKYIAQTLDSLLEQKTDFRFEIIVHDDVSSDDTANIIRRYAEKYPDIVKPIFESQNQYSKGVRITEEIFLPLAVGKYVAFCEGDDFWNDPNKLQQQINILESDDSISMCCHANKRINSKNGKLINVLRSVTKKDGFIAYEDCLSESNFPHLTSMVIRREDYEKMPVFFNKAPVGDYPLRAYALCLGKVYYIDKAMSTYRVMTASSWSKMYRYNADYRYETNKKMDEFLVRYDEYTNHKYHNYIEDLICRKDFATALFTGHYEEAKASPLYAKSGVAKKFLVFLGMHNKKIALKLGYIYSYLKNTIKP